MVSYLDKKNNYDFIHQFQWIKGENKPKLKRIIVDTNNNEAVKRSNLIYSTYYSLLLLFNQKPLVKTTNKSIANFNIRPNMHLGGQLTLSRKSYYFNSFIYHINLKSYENNVSYVYKNGKYNIERGYGLEDLRSKMFLIYHITMEDKIGGGNIRYCIDSPVRYVPFYYFPS